MGGCTSSASSRRRRVTPIVEEGYGTKGMCPMGYTISTTTADKYSSTYSRRGFHHSRSSSDGSSMSETTLTVVHRFDPRVQIHPALLLEHYQPYEFPIVPIINTHTQSLVRSSFKKIIDTEFDCEETVSGKMSGASFFYDQFFKQLFLRLRDFERIFPDIKSRAVIISKVMAMALSINVNELQKARAKCRSLGAFHEKVVKDPWLFGVYVTTLISTVRFCLGDDASEVIMSAWMHLFAWVLRNMMPEYLDRLKFDRYYDGADNATDPEETKKAATKATSRKPMEVTKKALVSPPQNSLPAQYNRAAYPLAHHSLVSVSRPIAAASMAPSVVQTRRPSQALEGKDDEMTRQKSRVTAASFDDDYYSGIIGQGVLHGAGEERNIETSESSLPPADEDPIPLQQVTSHSSVVQGAEAASTSSSSTSTFVIPSAIYPPVNDSGAQIVRNRTLLHSSNSDASIAAVPRSNSPLPRSASPGALYPATHLNIPQSSGNTPRRKLMTVGRIQSLPTNGPASEPATGATSPNTVSVTQPGLPGILPSKSSSPPLLEQSSSINDA